MELFDADDGPINFNSFFSAAKHPTKAPARTKPTARVHKVKAKAESPAAHKPDAKDKKKALFQIRESASRHKKGLSVKDNNKRKTEGAPEEGRHDADVVQHKKTQRVEKEFWPFEVDYNDHFETSFQAIQDLQPILELLCKKLEKPPSGLAVYDPFFCKGSIRRHYVGLGFTNFIHRNRDFYKDVESGQIPEYDILVTNPPYSGDHKEHILDFCLRSGKPWALLMPNYVANKAYFAQLLGDTATPPAHRPFFVTPASRYSYDHPEGTGHQESPFFSIWYVGLGPHTEAIHGACRARLKGSSPGAPPAKSGRTPEGGGKSGAEEGPGDKGGRAGAAGGCGGWPVSLARSVEQLRQAGAVPTGRRLNPKQRKRLKRQQQAGAGADG